MKPFLLATLSLSLAAVLLPLPAKAQVPSPKEIADLAVLHNDALAANRKILENYHWNYRIEVQEDNVLQWVDLVNIKMGADGRPIFTQINREQIVEKQRGLFRKSRKQEKGFEQKDRIVEYVSKWIIAYNRLPADRIHTLFRKAAESGAIRVSPRNPNLIGVSASNVRDSNANDQLSLWLNKENGHPISFSFTVPVEPGIEGFGGEKLSAVINYRYLQNGEAFYPELVDVMIPSRNLQIKVENVNIQKKP